MPGMSSLRKRSHKKDVSKAKKVKIPKRRSTRINKSSTPTHEEPVVAIDGEPSSDDSITEEPIPRRITRGVGVSSLRAIWDSEGKKMFELLSKVKVSKSSCFDLSFYNDQKGERKQEMYLNKVTKEFVEQEKARKNREAIAERNRMPALGIICATTPTESRDERKGRYK